jgi:phytoene dehydrogenase-like protein
MSTRLIAKRIQVWEGEPVIMVARVESAGGTPLLAAQVTSVNIDVFDMTSATQATEVYSQGPVDPTTVYFDTLQHDDAENLLGDSGGYNFRYVLSPSDYALQGAKTYRIQIVSLIGSGNNVQVYDVVVGELL